jgi:hypothetical protein
MRKSSHQTALSGRGDEPDEGEQVTCPTLVDAKEIRAEKGECLVEVREAKHDQEIDADGERDPGK